MKKAHGRSRPKAAEMDDVRCVLQPDEMEAIHNYEDKDVNSCDACGGKATETLFEFRCFKRKDHGKDRLNLTIRRKYTLVACISK